MQEKVEKFIKNITDMYNVKNPIYLEKHKNHIEESLVFNLNTYMDKTICRSIITVMVFLSQAENFKDIKDAYDFGNNVSKDWSGSVWNILLNAVSKYAKYGEFFYELYLGHPLDKNTKEKLQPYINDRKEFENDKTEQIKQERTAFFKEERINSILKEINENNDEIKSLQSENDRLTKSLEHDDQEIEEEM